MIFCVTESTQKKKKEKKRPQKHQNRVSPSSQTYQQETRPCSFSFFPLHIFNKLYHLLLHHTGTKKTHTLSQNPHLLNKTLHTSHIAQHRSFGSQQILVQFPTPPFSLFLLCILSNPTGIFQWIIQLPGELSSTKVPLILREACWQFPWGFVVWFPQPNWMQKRKPPNSRQHTERSFRKAE